jgi:hypothetical protein
MKVMSRGYPGGSGSGGLLGSWPSQRAGWRQSSCTLGASLFCLCLSHTTPFTTPSHIPLSCSPLLASAPFRPLFLLLPGPALPLPLGITHSLYVHNSPLVLAHAHTHTPTAQRYSFPHTPSHTHFSVPVTTLTCKPAHPHTQRATHLHACILAPRFQGQGHTVDDISTHNIPASPHIAQAPIPVLLCGLLVPSLTYVQI